MSRDRDYHFRDEFTFKTVPFLVEVYDETHYWGRYDKRPPCKRRVAKVRPDYPYTIEKEWPKGADKHFSDIVWYERPKKAHWFLPKAWAIAWEKEENEPKRDVEEQVERVMKALFAEWNEHVNPDGFADIGMAKPNL